MKPLSSLEVSQWLAQHESGSVIYLLGVGGCGMSGLAHLLLDLGYKVVGSDKVANQEVAELRRRGAQIYQGHASEQLIDARPACVVYSSAIRRDNPELRAAEERKIPIVRRAALLAALVNAQASICVAGMHGKTTTTAWLAYALEQLGAAPSYAVGSAVPQLKPHARYRPAVEGQSWFVVETDESDGTLLEFQPRQSILLNIDEEHLDYYVNLEAIAREFRQFANQTRERVIFCADDERLSELLAQQPHLVSYGFHPLAHYRLERAPQGMAPQGERFEMWHAGARLGSFTIRLCGEKNVSNAGAVVAFLHQLGHDAAAIQRAIGEFTGAARRQQELFRDARYRVLDDYGHHPNEIRPTLEAIKAGARRLLVVFQPHRFTRTEQLLTQFASSFRDADRLWISAIYAAGETPIPGIDGAVLAQAIRGQGQKVEYVPELENILERVRAELEPGDTVLFLGAGTITEAAHRLAGELGQTKSQPGEDLWGQLVRRVSAGTVIKRDEALAKKTTLRVGGRADFYVEPASEADLAAVLQFCREHDLRFMMLGRGSNLLVKDEGFRGVVVCLAQAHFNRLEFVGDRLHCGAGAKLKTVAVEARRHSLAGLEFLEGIPGSVGGALRMNAGAMGSWIFDVVESVRFMDFAGRIEERATSEVNVEYRGCPLLRDHIALGAILKGELTSQALITERMNAYSHKRWDTQPAQPSAGCMFKNPPTIPAGKLIDELGLKGTRMGGARISDLHGNFIVNEGNATAQDVLALIQLVQERARALRGIELETEVQIIGG